MGNVSRSAYCCLDDLKHLIVQDARRLQALHEQVGLVLIGIQAIFKRPHHPTYSTLGLCCQRAQFIPMPEGRGPLAPNLVGECTMHVKRADFKDQSGNENGPI